LAYEISTYALLAYSSLFAIVSPFATVPTFMAITERDDMLARLSMARRGCMVAGGVLIFFSLVGDRILEALRVSVPALQIAGGLVILRVAFGMLKAAPRKLTTEERAEAVEKDDIAIAPLAVPVLCGPGTITTGIVLGSAASGIVDHLVLLSAVLAVYGTTFGILWLAVRYSSSLSATALRVLGRLMGVLLAAIAVEFMLQGLRAALPA